MSTNRCHPTAALPLAVLTASLTALFSACSSAPDAAQSNTATDQQSIFPAQASRQRRAPDTRAMQAPPPPTFPNHLTTPLPEQDAEHAARSLESILAEYAPPTLPDPATTDQPEQLPKLEGESLEALRAYLEGRMLLLTDGPVAAEPELRTAARLDPDASETWQALADAQSQLGSAAATSSYKRALDRDPTNTAALEKLSKAALDRRDYKQALTYLAHLKSQDLASIDPALPNIIDLRLGQTLLPLGHTGAAAESFISAADLPDQFTRSTNYLNDLSSLYRQRPLLLLRAGDAYLRLGDFEQADAAYARADAIPSTDDLHQILTRRVYALLRDGKSAAAAGALINRLDKQSGLVDSALLDLFQHVARHSSADQLLVGALTQRLDEATVADNPIRGAHLSLARAHCLPPDRTTAALRDTLNVYPAHTAACRALLSAQPTDAGRTSETIALIDAHPLHTPLYIDELLGARPASLFIGLVPVSDPPTPAAALCRAYLLSDAARPADSLDALTPITPAHGATHSQATILRATLLRRLARIDRLRDLLAELPPAGSSPHSDLARAQIHLILGQTARASAALTPHLGASVLHLSTAGHTAELRNEPQTARTIYERAIALGTIDDIPYRRLLALLRPKGAAPDQQGYIDTYRDLRAHIPWSAAVPFERAVSDIQGGQGPRGERILAEMLTDHPREHSAAELMGDLMHERAEYESLEGMLRSRLETMPGQSGVVIRLARVLSARGDKDGAAELLAQRLATAPGDDQSSRALEDLLRHELGRAQDADELAFARLTRDSTSPAGKIELLKLYTDSGRGQDAQRVLTEFFELEETQGAALPAGLLRLLARETERGPKGDDEGRIDALPLLEIVLHHRPDAPIGVYALRLDALVARGAPSDQVIRATDAAVRAHPELGPALYETVGMKCLEWARVAFVNEDSERGVASVLSAVDIGAHALEIHDPPRHESMALILHASGLLSISPAHRERAGDLAAAMFRLAAEEGRSDEMISVYIESSSGEPSDYLRGEFYYNFANFLSGTAHDELCETLYRSAIRFNPTHAMALNNYGYRLIENGGDLDEAHRLLSRAYRFRGNNPRNAADAIIDSLGWVRFKLGMIDDGVDDKGLLIPGAVTLLDEALDIAVKGVGSAAAQDKSQAELTATVLASHLGDALWVDGDRERAMTTWRNAYDRASAMLSEYKEEELGEAALREIERVRSGSAEKLRAAEEDRDPPVEMIVREVRPAEEPAGSEAGRSKSGTGADKDAF